MGTGSSSKTTEDDDVRNRLNSGDFQKITPPSTPSIEFKNDEMSYSGILVEKPESETPTAASSTTANASFAADLSTPPASNRSKSRSKAAAAAAAKEQPRRIVKATPPPKAVADTDDGNRNDNNVDSPAVHHSPAALASPIGANAATEMLEESIEKNASKNKRMERVTNKQKNDREKLLQEKRRRQQPSSDNKPKVQANPFSRFLSAFSVDANPKHKRKESNDAGDLSDPNKRLKFGFNEATAVTKPDGAVHTESISGTDTDSDSEEPRSATISPWIAAASVATIAILVIAIVRGSKKK